MEDGEEGGGGGRPVDGEAVLVAEKVPSVILAPSCPSLENTWRGAAGNLCLLGPARTKLALKSAALIGQSEAGEDLARMCHHLSVIITACANGDGFFGRFFGVCSVLYLFSPFTKP